MQKDVGKPLWFLRWEMVVTWTRLVVMKADKNGWIGGGMKVEDEEERNEV